MGIHGKYVNKKTRGFFIATNFEIWVYKENMCLFIHIGTFFYLQIIKYGYTRE